MEIPAECMMGKVPPGGIAQLPLIYREMALGMIVPTLDMRIYSTRRGRMWRVPNVQRSNGKYKVPISLDEAMDMTAETYEQVCSEPRYYRGREAEYPAAPWLVDPKGEVPMPSQPELNLGLQALFSSKKMVVDGLVRRQAKARDDRAALRRFEGAMPVSVKEILNGQHVHPDAHFNDIALQFSILAAEFGLTEDEFINACEGLIKNHSGDSQRYSTPRRREDALRERLAYVSGSNVYTFSLKALRAVCDPGYVPADLFGALASESARYAPEVTAEQAKELDPASLLSAAEAEALRAGAENDSGGMRLTPMGVYQRREDGMERLSDLAIFNPRVLRAADGGQLVGVSAKVASIKDPGARPMLRDASFRADDFQSRSSLDAAFQRHMSYYKGSDIGATILRTILVDSAIKREAVQFTLGREGMDVIERPDNVGPDHQSSLAWVTHERVLLPEDLGAGDHAEEDARFLFRPPLASNQDTKLDAHLYDVPDMNDPDFERFMEHLLSINSPQVVALTLGWFVSCFHRRLHHLTHNEFPILWIYGAAGSGKTSTPTILYHLFTSRPPSGWITLQKGTTDYVWQVMMMQSVTAPLVVDEFKKIDFPQQRYNEIISHLRSAYNSTIIKRAGVRTGAARASYQDSHDFERAAPIAVLSEAYTDETAMQERSIPVAVRPTDASQESWDYVNRGTRPEFLTRIGSLLVRRTLMMSMDEFEERWFTARHESQEQLPNFPARIVANNAVVIMGLDFLCESLKIGAGLDLHEKFEELKAAVYESAVRHSRVLPTTSEAIKTLRDIAYITNALDPTANPNAIRENYEYAFVNGELHINMHRLGIRYAAAAHHNHMQLYFDNPEVLIAGLARLPAVISDNATYSPLYTHKGARIFSFDPKILAENGVEPFKGSPGF